MGREKNHLPQRRAELVPRTRGELSQDVAHMRNRPLPSGGHIGGGLVAQAPMGGAIAMEPGEDREQRLFIAAREQLRMTRRRLGQRARIGAHSRAALAERLRRRQSKALIEGRKYGDESAGIERPQGRVFDPFMPEEAPAIGGMGFEPRDELIRHPALAADDDETGIGSLEPVEGVEQKAVIFAWLDRADAEHEAEPVELGESRAKRDVGQGRRDRDKIRPERDHLRTHRPTGKAPGDVLEVAVDARRYGQHIIGISELVGEMLGEADDRVGVA